MNGSASMYASTVLMKLHAAGRISWSAMVTEEQEPDALQRHTSQGVEERT